MEQVDHIDPSLPNFAELDIAGLDADLFGERITTQSYLQSELGELGSKVSLSRR